MHRHEREIIGPNLTFSTLATRFSDGHGDTVKTPETNASHVLIDLQADHDDILERLIVLVDLCVLYILNDIKPSRRSPKHAVLVLPLSASLQTRHHTETTHIQPRRRHGGDEELRAVGVGTGIGHTERIRPIMQRLWMKLVLHMRMTMDRFAARTIPHRVSRLEHL
jgi:hypothetical protein